MFRTIITIIFLLYHTFIFAQLPKKAPCPTGEWIKSTPVEQALDSVLLDKLVQLIREGEAYPDYTQFIDYTQRILGYRRIFYRL